MAKWRAGLAEWQQGIALFLVRRLRGNAEFGQCCVGESVFQGQCQKFHKREHKTDIGEGQGQDHV